MNESTSPVSRVSIPALSNLSELRGVHSSFLQRQENRSRDFRPSPGEILGLLDAARVLGRRLSDYYQRETVQGIIDYWASRLISQAPLASDDLSSFYLDDFDESSVGTTSETVWSSTAATAKADEVVHKLGPLELTVFRRLVFRLVQLKERSTDFYLVPLPITDSLLEEPAAKSLIEQLVNAGLVQEVKAGDKTIAFQLASARLIFDWDALAKLAVRRRGFRELAHGWDKGGRLPAALLDGGQALTKAAAFVDLDEVESAFIDQSRRKRDKQWRFVAIGAFIVAGIVCFAYMKVKGERDELARTLAKLENAVTELKEQKEIALKNLASAEAALKAAEALREATKPLVQSPERAGSVNIPGAVKYNEKAWHDASESLERVKRNISEQSRKTLKQ